MLQMGASEPTKNCAKSRTRPLLSVRSKVPTQKRFSKKIVALTIAISLPHTLAIDYPSTATLSG